MVPTFTNRMPEAVPFASGPRPPRLLRNRNAYSSSKVTLGRCMAPGVGVAGVVHQAVKVAMTVAVMVAAAAKVVGAVVMVVVGTAAALMEVVAMVEVLRVASMEEREAVVRVVRAPAAMAPVTAVKEADE